MGKDEFKANFGTPAGTTGGAADGATASGNPVLEAGVDSAGKAQTIKTDKDGRQEVVKPGSWAVTHAPAANAVATISQAAGGAGVKNVCTGLAATLTSAGGAPTPTQIKFHLRDGATGAGTILKTIALSLTAVEGACAYYEASDLNIEGSANTAMTFESAVAPGANAFATVAVQGYTKTA